jgi:hypothetical protein
MQHPPSARPPYPQQTGYAPASPHLPSSAECTPLGVAAEHMSRSTCDDREHFVGDGVLYSSRPGRLPGADAPSTPAPDSPARLQEIPVPAAEDVRVFLLRRPSAEKTGDPLAGSGRRPSVQAARQPPNEPTSGPSVELVGVRGAQIGDHNRQINRFVVRSDRLDLDFGAVLRRPGVVAAVDRLRADPADRALRDDVVRALAATGWFIDASPLVITAGEPALGFLERILLFVVPPAQAVQVGDHGTQHNTFSYVVTDAPDAARMLASRPGLARELADHVCPPGDAGRTCPPGGTPVAPDRLERALLAELEHLPVRWSDDRARAVQHETPVGPGPLRVENADGVTIGQENSINVEHIVDIGAVALPTTGTAAAPLLSD